MRGSEQLLGSSERDPFHRLLKGQEREPDVFVAEHDVLSRDVGKKEYDRLLPWISDGMWFLTQMKRWGMVQTAPDYAAVARQINRIDIYKQAASAVGGISVPAGEMRSSTLFDGKVWDGSNPAAYADSFALKRR